MLTVHASHTALSVLPPSCCFSPAPGPKSGQSLAVVLRMRVREERVAVRRAALHALNGFIGFVSPDIGQEVLCVYVNDICCLVGVL